MVKKIGVIAVISLILIMFSSCGKHGERLNINIAEEELHLFEGMYKAETVQYFTDKYDVEYTDTFWSGEFGGESPEKVLREKAIAELVPLKVEQMLAKEYGLISSCDYSDIQAMMEEENKKRKQAKEDGGVVYGVVEYTMESFYRDYMAKLGIELQQVWEEKVTPEKKQLEKYYDEIKETYYRKMNEASLTIYTFDKEEMAQKFIVRAQNGEDITDEAKVSAINEETYTTNNDNMRFLSLYYPGAYEQIENNEAPSISGPYMSADGVSIVLVNSISDGGYNEFEEVEENVLSMYIEQELNEYINELLKDYEVSVQ